MAVTYESSKNTLRVATNFSGVERQAPAEFGVLCLVAEVKPDYGRMATALKGDVDWDILVSLAAAHSVRLQLIRALRKLDWIGVPAEIKRSLLDFLQLHKVRSLLVAGELIRVSDELSQRAIRFATFKGPALAAGLYGDLSLREFNDVDLIVEEQQIVRAEAALGSLGYRPVLGSSVFRGAFLSYQKQYMFVRENNPSLAIALHWDFAGTFVPFPLSAAEIWDNLGQWHIGGRIVPTLGQADLGLLLAGHGAKEGWRRLGWVSDFAMFIEKHPDVDWRTLLHRARRRASSRSLLVGWQLAAVLLGTKVEADLLGLAENNMQARRAAEAVVRRFRSGYPVPASEGEFGEPDLRENWLQRAQAVGSLIVTRTIGDYLSMPLPRPLWRIYHLTRPFRLASKVFTNPGSTMSQEKREKFLSRIPQY
jgi:hypothetical protein